jgi:hypothetical protein
MVIDLFPPSTRDVNGVHGEFWKLLEDDSFRLSYDEPLVLTSYSAGQTKVAYVEPTAAGREFIDMPLFLTAERYAPVPLEETYKRAYAGLSKRWKTFWKASQPVGKVPPNRSRSRELLVAANLPENGKWMADSKLEKFARVAVR